MGLPVHLLTRRRVGLLAVICVGLAALVYWVGPNAHANPRPDDVVEAIVGKGKMAVAEFGSTRCKACREMKVVLDDLQRTHGDSVAIADVDLFSAAGRGMISRYRIQMMPTQVFYDAAGNETGRHLGPISATEILKRLGIEAAPSGTRTQ